MTVDNNDVAQSKTPAQNQMTAQLKPVITPRQKGVPKPQAKWEIDVHERLKTIIKKYAAPLQGLLARDANEGDTRLFVTDFLYEALGYDKYTDLTTEYMVRGDFADYGVRIDKEMIAFIEVKRVATKLDSKHLKQVEMYAVNEGVAWVILTNGVHWKVYHITGGLPMILDLAIEVDLLGDDTPQKKADKLFYITRESLKKRQIDEVWKTQRATSPKALAQALLSPSVITALQSALKKQNGYKVDDDELVRLVKGTVLRTECFDKS